LAKAVIVYWDRSSLTFKFPNIKKAIRTEFQQSVWKPIDLEVSRIWAIRQLGKGGLWQRNPDTSCNTWGLSGPISIF